MKVLFLNIFPKGLTQYLFSSYLLINYLQKNEKIANKIEFEVINISTEKGNIIGLIENRTYDILCLSCYIWNKGILLNLVKNMNNNTKIIWGGPEISESFIKEVTGTQENVFIIGEGEKKLEFVLMHYLNAYFETKYTLNPVNWDNNLFYIDDTQNNNTCPFFQIYTTGLIPNKLIQYQIVLLETQRGCIFNCSYCNYNKTKSRIRYYELNDILAELEYLTQKKARAIRIVDAVFTSDLNRAKEIIRFLLKIRQTYNYIPAIFLETDIRCVDEDFLSLLDKMKNRQKVTHSLDNLNKSNVAQMYSNIINEYKCILSIGIQSMSEQALHACGRYMPTSDHIQKFINYIRKYNLSLKIDMILGMPLETKESYYNGLEQLLPIFDGADHILNIHILKVLPNTRLMNESEKYEIIFENTNNNVIATSTLDRNTLFEMKVLSAILFRVINSDLRKSFIHKMQIERNLYALLSTIKMRLDKMNQLPLILSTYNESINDEYWNTEIYQDLPENVLESIFDSII